ncbi:uncharacterized protein CBL_01013 [Carabus blaptoides fortunei]
MTAEQNLINVGDYVVVQRQSFTKLHKLKANGTVSLGKDQVELENAIGKPYYTTFRMVTRPKNKRVYALEVSEEYVNCIQNVNIDKSGIDNRDIIDDGRSQQLTTEEITKLRDNALSSSDIVEKLITNSKTFGAKTEYSQEKYLKKKERKYFEFIQIRKPSIRLIAEIYYRLDPGKVLGVRLDDLSQILSYSNVQDDSNILLYDSGTCGLLAAAVMSRIGRDTSGTLVHMHPGNVCQKEAFLAMQFPTEQCDRCINVCLYSVLRCFYQEHNTAGQSEAVTTEQNTARQSSAVAVETNDSDKGKSDRPMANTAVVEINENNKRKCDQSDERPAKRPCWQIDNEKACKFLKNKFDSLVIVAKEHPLNIVNELLTFLNDGRPFVVFSLLRESLESLYVELKNRKDIISLRLTSTLMRNYQVLPDRTHPDVNMTCGGYILTGFIISTKNN